MCILSIYMFIGVTTTKLPTSYGMMNHDHIETGKKEQPFQSHYHLDGTKIDVKNLRGDNAQIFTPWCQFSSNEY
jgi:hypothetical protein